jgi:hypothetical protein
VKADCAGLGRHARLRSRGYGGSTLNPEVLATTDGHHFRVTPRLPVPVRYAGATAVGRLIRVFSG